MKDDTDGRVPIFAKAFWNDFYTFVDDGITFPVLGNAINCYTMPDNDCSTMISYE